MFALVERDSLLQTLWQQTVKPALMQVLDPQALGSRPVSPCIGFSSGHRLNGCPSGACPHSQAYRPKGCWRCCKGEQWWQTGQVWLGYSDAGALQKQDTSRHQICDSQAEKQHLSPLQETVQSIERCHHSIHCICPLTSVEGHFMD